MIKAKVLIRQDGIITMALENGRILKLTIDQANRMHRGIASGFCTEGYIDGNGRFVFEYVDAEIVNEFGVPQHKALVPCHA